MVKIIIKKIAKMIKNEEKEVFKRRDRLVEIQEKAQKLWSGENTHVRELINGKKKLFVTIPYPYVNSRLHLGHGFTYIKADIYSRYKSLKGFNTLFPLGFHGTGMPIYAAAKKLQIELETIGLERLLKASNDRAQRVPEVLKEKISQFEIMIISGVKIEEIKNFIDPKYWLTYFPDFVKKDLEKLGNSIDFSRSFVTTDMNPYYDSFISWQFEELKKGSHIKFGVRPCIYSPKDNQMCADHDRSVGEGVLPQEYTVIKLILQSFNSPKLKQLREENISATFVLPAATLRPETVYGQTNCFVHPSGEYSAFLMKNNEVWICSERSAYNACFQNLTEEFGKHIKICSFFGTDLIGEKVFAPLSFYQEVFVWPMFSLNMEKGTGIVTSVPSDSPDDYAVMVDLKKKRELREKFGLKDDQVLPFNPVEILEVPEYSRLSGVTAYELFKISSMNDKEKLAEAKAEVYQKGFYSGKLLVGEWAGNSVFEAKNEIRAKLLAENQAIKYWEPDGVCFSRTGGVCVVALLDQWYINYGEKSVESKLCNYVKSSVFTTFNESVRNLTLEGLQWLKEWGCSRSYGLGTRIPWDRQFVIESLSDSTIYMAYYTIAPFLQEDIYGKKPGSLDIKPEDIQHTDWSFIFLGEPRSTESKISLQKLQQMRDTFLYWYPVDVRFSGKDLAKNHLSMSLYNHEFIWGKVDSKTMTRGYYLNGMMTIDGRKMSKQEGNFMTIADTLEKYGADASRIMLANAGDSLDDANAVLSEADKAILKLYALENWLNDIRENISTFRCSSIAETDFFDRVFEHETKALLKKAEEAYETMTLREAVKALFYTLPSVKEDYRISCGVHGMQAQLIKYYIRSLLITLFPLIPHFCEVMWIENYLPIIGEESATEFDRCRKADYPTTLDIDHILLGQKEFIKKVCAAVLSSFEKVLSKKKTTPKTVFVICSTEYKDWQIDVIEILRHNQHNFKDDIKEKFKENKKLTAQAIEFGTFKAKKINKELKCVLDIDAVANDYKLLCDNREMLTRDLRGCSLVILNAKDCLAHENKQVGQAAQNCVPGTPLIVIDY